MLVQGAMHRDTTLHPDALSSKDPLPFGGNLHQKVGKEEKFQGRGEPGDSARKSANQICDIFALQLFNRVLY